MTHKKVNLSPIISQRIFIHFKINMHYRHTIILFSMNLQISLAYAQSTVLEYFSYLFLKLCCSLSTWRKSNREKHVLYIYRFTISILIRLLSINTKESSISFKIKSGLHHIPVESSI